MTDAAVMMAAFSRCGLISTIQPAYHERLPRKDRAWMFKRWLLVTNFSFTMACTGREKL